MNWKTTIVGAVPVLLSAAETFLGLDFPGFGMSLTDALALAGVAFFAADARKKLP